MIDSVNINKNVKAMLSGGKPQSKNILDYIFDKRIKLLTKIYSVKITVSLSSVGGK
jgi:hypothetical protein